MPDRHEPPRAVARRASLDAVAPVPGADLARPHGHDFPRHGRPLLVAIPAGGHGSPAPSGRGATVVGR